MGRSLRAYLAFAAALGLSGCLLFTDPINKAPTVSIDDYSLPVVRGHSTQFTATVMDEDSLASLTVDWGAFKSTSQQGCGWITPADWVSPQDPLSLPTDVSYPFTPQSLEIVCVCARVIDHNGATGLRCSAPILPVNSAPVASIVDVSGALTGQPRPLCAQVHLSAEGSTFLPGDEFNWSIKYTGSDPTGKSVQLSPCLGVDAGKGDQCFYAGARGATGSGKYTVTLTIVDSVVLNGNTMTTPSNLAVFEIPVAADTPPCLQRTDPDVYAKRILLSRSADLGGTYQSRTFKVLGTADDCEPYPLPAGLPGPQTQFVWSVLDNTQTSPSWTYQTNTSDSFTVSQSLFPNARPGDTVQLRVEVRDTLVQTLYQSGGQVCSSDTDLCCGSSACGTPSDCVRWTTWTVQFQP